MRIQPGGAVMEAGAPIRFEGVSFRYEPRGPEVLAALDLEIAPGDFVGVIGPNGAGKSSFLRLLLGVFAPTVGRVLLGGRDVRRTPARELARRVAAVPQEEALEFPFTAFE